MNASSCHRILCVLLILSNFASVALTAEPSLLKVQPSPDGKSARIEVGRSVVGGTGLLELLDDVSGHCLRTLHAGSFSGGQTFTVGGKQSLPAGKYRVRYRGGLALAFDMEFALPNKEKWVNPTGLAFAGDRVYVLDCGFPPSPGAKPEQTPADEDPSEANGPSLYAFLRDGKPDPTFGYAGRATLFDKPAVIGCVAVDENGEIYFAREHEVRAFDKDGKRLTRTVGGLDETPRNVRNTAWCGGPALGPGRSLYIPCGPNIRVYDRTKRRFDGFLYSGSFTPNPNLYSRATASDRRASIYVTPYPAGNVIHKVFDTGKEIKAGYASDASEKMYAPMGMSAGGDLLWVADHGPGPGPFWDSGGGNEIVLFWDSGEKLVLLERFGVSGTAPEKLEFINPCATAQSPDHRALWVAEDGAKNPDGPPGNARVRKFRVTAAATEEVSLELK